MTELGTGLNQELTNALAQGIARGEELKRNRAALSLALDLSVGLFSQSALNEAQKDSAWPHTVHYGDLYKRLRQSANREELLAGIERSLAWAKGAIDAKKPDLVKVSKAARESWGAMREQLVELSNKIVDSQLDASLLSEPDFSLEMLAEFDRAELNALLAEVQKALETYKKVISDNGMFAAFSQDVDYGTSIFNSTDEGDSEQIELDLATTIIKLRDANALSYDGIFDDDFTCHVEAFWLGFETLMRACEQKLTVDTRPADEYLVDLCKSLIGR